MEGTAIVSQIVGILTSGITGLASGIGQGLTALVQSIFFVSTTVEGVTTTSMSTFGILVVVFAGLSLCIGLSRLIVSWLSSLGGRRL